MATKKGTTPLTPKQIKEWCEYQAQMSADYAESSGDLEASIAADIFEAVAEYIETKLDESPQPQPQQL